MEDLWIFFLLVTRGSHRVGFEQGVDMVAFVLLKDHSTVRSEKTQHDKC